MITAYDRPAPGKVGHSHPDTSREAAELIAPSSGSQRFRVLRAIAGSTTGATDDEIQNALEMSGNTQRPRRMELEEMGWITVVPGARRPTSTGGSARVWTLTPEGRQAWIDNDGVVMCPKV